MDEWSADLLTACGLFLTLAGSCIAAFSVILRESDAVEIGVARWAADTDDENLKLPMVQNLLASSRGAKRGLLLIAAGTVLQLVPVLCRLLPL